jgi:ankyrin repeat protein
VKTDFGWTALHYAAWKGHTEMARVLLDAGVDIEAQGNEGLTALHLACTHNRIDVVNALLDADADVSVRDLQGWTGFAYASFAGNIEIVHRLMKMETDVNALSGPSLTLLLSERCGGNVETAWQSHPDTLRNLLLRSKANVSDDGGGVPHVLTSYTSPSTPKASVNAKDGTGWTVLHWASFNGRSDMVQVLLDYGANPSIQSKSDGLTALHAAAIGGNKRVVALLLNTGANPLVKDKWGRTALHMVLIRWNIEIACQLLKNIRESVVTANTIPEYDASEDRLDVATYTDDNSSLRGYLHLCLDLIQLYPNDRVIRGCLANIYLIMGMEEMALSSYHMALRLTPANRRVTRNDQIIHRHTCDSCNVSPIIGFRHKCKICRWSYDLCQTCFESMPHPHPDHAFLTIPGEGWCSQ